MNQIAGLPNAGKTLGKPCSEEGCDGRMMLSQVNAPVYTGRDKSKATSSPVAGMHVGAKTVWKCQKCDHQEDISD